MEHNSFKHHFVPYESKFIRGSKLIFTKSESQEDALINNLFTSFKCIYLSFIHKFKIGTFFEHIATETDLFRLTAHILC